MVEVKERRRVEKVCRIRWGLLDEMSKGVMSSGKESDELLYMTHHISTLLLDGGLNNIMR